MSDDKKNFKWYILYVPIKEEERMLTKVKTVCQKLFGEEYSNHIENIMVLKSSFDSIKNGEIKTVERIAYPGYLLMRLNMSYQLKMKILSIHGIRSFLSNAKGEPQGISDKEYDELLLSVQKIATKNNNKNSYKIGDRVIVKEGSFQEFEGIISSVNNENKTVHLKIFVFGKEIELQIAFTGIERIK